MAKDLGEIVYPFEDTGENLSLLPLGARRALDVSGFRLSLEGFQSLGYDDRVDLADAGTKDKIDVAAVEKIIRKSAHPPTRIKPVADADPLTVPEQLNAALGSRRAVDITTWTKLRSIDRFALLHVMRRSIAHDDAGRLEAAVENILGQRKSQVPNTKRSEHPPVPAFDVEMPEGLRAPAVPKEIPPAPRLKSSVPPPLAPIPAPVFGPPPAPVEVVSTHLTRAGEVHMVGVESKPETHRRAVAKGSIRMKPETAQRVVRNDVPKGELFATARIAGIMAAKKTPDLVPLCHPLALTKIEVLLDVEVASGTVTVTSVVEALDRTGVEMEALTAVSVALLTVYDMLKGIDKDLTIMDIKLVSKTGGKSS